MRLTRVFQYQTRNQADIKTISALMRPRLVAQRVVRCIPRCIHTGRILHNAEQPVPVLEQPANEPESQTSSRQHLAYQQIVAQSKRRVKVLKRELGNGPEWKASASAKNMPHIKLQAARISFADFVQRPAPGDIVGTEAGIELVLHEDTDNLGQPQFITCDIKGDVRRINRNKMRFRLGRAMDAEKLYDSFVELNDATIPQQYAIRHSGRAAILTRLRPFAYRSELMAPRVTRALQQIFTQLVANYGSETFNIPIIALSSHVEQLINSQFDPTVLNAAVASLSTAVPSTHEEDIYDMLDSVQAELVLAVVDVVRTNQSLPTVISDDHMGIVTFVPGGKALNLKGPLSDAIQELDTLVGSMLNTETRGSIQLRPGSDVAKLVDVVRRFALEEIDEKDLTQRSTAALVLKGIKSIPTETVVTAQSAMQLLKQLGLANSQQGPRYDRWIFDFARQPAGIAAGIDPRSDTVSAIRAASTVTNAFAIDNATAHEIDDAVSYTPHGDGSVTVGVHIADPASLFSSFADNEHIQHAYRATSSTYLVGESRPMLDAKVTSAVDLGMGQKQPVRCTTIRFKWDPASGSVDLASVSVMPEILNKVTRLTYDRVDQILAGTVDSPHANDLTRLFEVSKRLAFQRRKRGALVLWSAPELKADEEDVTVCEAKGISQAEGLVSELMIMANRLVADYCQTNNIPGLYRTQHDPNMPEWTFSSESTPDDPWKPLSLQESLQIIPYLTRAVVSTELGCHDSLAVPAYMHATSPLRRFQDLVAHYQIQSFLLDKRDRPMLSQSQLRRIALHINMQQQLLKTMQRHNRVFHVLQQLSNGTNKVVDAVVRSVSSQTASVLLPDYGVNGIIPQPEHAEIGTTIRCRITHVDPFTYTLGLVRCT